MMSILRSLGAKMNAIPIKFLILLSALLPNICFGASLSLEIDACDQTRGWLKGVIAGREIAYTNKEGAVLEGEVNVPVKGRYQLIAYAHHNWKDSCPKIYIESIDSSNRPHQGNHQIENIWYDLGPAGPGRWFFATLSDNSYWELPAGTLKFKIWVEARKSTWDSANVPMEGAVALDNIFLIPVVGSSQGYFLPWMAGVETGSGGWEVSDYDGRYATNLIRQEKPGPAYKYKINLPFSGKYRGFISILSGSGNILDIKVVNNGRTSKRSINVPAKETWNLIALSGFNLSEGEAVISLQGQKKGELAIDYILFFPESGNFCAGRFMN